MSKAAAKKKTETAQKQQKQTFTDNPLGNNQANKEATEFKKQAESALK